MNPCSFESSPPLVPGEAVSGGLFLLSSSFFEVRVVGVGVYSIVSVRVLMRPVPTIVPGTLFCCSWPVCCRIEPNACARCSAWMLCCCACCWLVWALLW